MKKGYLFIFILFILFSHVLPVYPQVTNWQHISRISRQYKNVFSNTLAHDTLNEQFLFSGVDDTWVSTLTGNLSSFQGDGVASAGIIDYGGAYFWRVDTSAFTIKIVLEELGGMNTIQFDTSNAPFPKVTPAHYYTTYHQVKSNGQDLFLKLYDKGYFYNGNTWAEFDTLYNLNNREVAAIETNGNTLWIAFSTDTNFSKMNSSSTLLRKINTQNNSYTDYSFVDLGLSVNNQIFANDVIRLQSKEHYLMYLHRRENLVIWDTLTGNKWYLDGTRNASYSVFKSSTNSLILPSKPANVNTRIEGIKLDDFHRCWFSCYGDEGNYSQGVSGYIDLLSDEIEVFSPRGGNPTIPFVTAFDIVVDQRNKDVYWASYVTDFQAFGFSPDSIDLWRFPDTSTRRPTDLKETVENIEIRVFPNPATDKLIIQSNGIIRNWELIDTKGRLVLKGKGTAIDVVYVNEGLYFLRFTHEGMVIARPIIIHKD